MPLLVDFVQSRRGYRLRRARMRVRRSAVFCGIASISIVES